MCSNRIYYELFHRLGLNLGRNNFADNVNRKYIIVKISPFCVQTVFHLLLQVASSFLKRYLDTVFGYVLREQTLEYHQNTIAHARTTCIYNSTNYGCATYAT